MALVAQTVQNLLAMQETSVRSLGWEDPLEECMATHSSILAWKIPWKEEPGRIQSMWSQRVRHDSVTSLFFFQCYMIFHSINPRIHVYITCYRITPKPLTPEYLLFIKRCFWQLSRWLRQSRIHLQFGRPGFDPWIEKVPWRRAWQPTPVFLPEESPWTEEPGGLESTGLQRVGHSWATKQGTHSCFLQ